MYDNAAGLREDLPPTEEWVRPARIPSRRPTTAAWALLDESAAEALREDTRAGRRREARGALLNRAAGPVSLGTVAPGSTSRQLPPR